MGHKGPKSSFSFESAPIAGYETGVQVEDNGCGLEIKFSSSENPKRADIPVVYTDIQSENIIYRAKREKYKWKIWKYIVKTKLQVWESENWRYTWCIPRIYTWCIS
ncbi:hypothetical protein R3W88_009747 [Solanum pinnatisectum]|uniref:Uncharacterized protein n=1 Tax=Solanum pinnatisectum TaxID=50273 RepID=A0AAV9MCA1_9SOLN|nr:hypothetical protein R3W88_009747 [Solanum pinnatisectum]